MSLELRKESFCENCANFEPECFKSGHFLEFKTNTVVSCKQLEKCRNIAETIREELEKENEDAKKSN